MCSAAITVIRRVIDRKYSITASAPRLRDIATNYE